MDIWNWRLEVPSLLGNCLVRMWDDLKSCFQMYKAGQALHGYSWFTNAG